MECTFVHFQSDLMNISVIKNMHFFRSHFKPLHQSKCCGALIDNRAGVQMFVSGDKEIETKMNLRYSLKDFFGGQCTVGYVYKITPY